MTRCGQSKKPSPINSLSLDSNWIYLSRRCGHLWIITDGKYRKGAQPYFVCEDSLCQVKKVMRRCSHVIIICITAVTKCFSSFSISYVQAKQKVHRNAYSSSQRTSLVSFLSLASRFKFTIQTSCWFFKHFISLDFASRNTA